MKRIKMLPAMLLLVLCVGVLCMGIYAATPNSNQITGSITVNSANPEVHIECLVDGVSKKEYTTRNGEKWTISGLKFITENANSKYDVEDIEITLRITNNSSRPLGAYFSEEAKTTNATGEDIMTHSTINGVGDLSNTQLASAYFKSYSYIAPSEKGLQTKSGYDTYDMIFVLRCEYINDIETPSETFDYYLNIEEYQPNCNASQISYTNSVGSSALSGLVKLPNDSSFTSICDEAFRNNTAITHIVVPTNVKTIGENSIRSVSLLEGCSLPNSLEDVGINVLRSNNNLVSFFLPTYYKIPTSMFAACAKLEYINMPETLEYIGYQTFRQCTKLKRVCFSESLKEIYYTAFAETGLIQINLPNSVEAIGPSAFSDCTALKSVVLSQNEKFTELASQTFDGCTSLTSIVIPSNVKNLRRFVFGGSGLMMVTLNGTEVIGDQAFYECSSLKTVKLNDGLLEIGADAFYGCPLTNVSIPDSVGYLASSAFRNCTNLKYNMYKTGKYIGNSNNPYIALIGTTGNDLEGFEFNENCKFVMEDCFPAGLLIDFTKIMLPEGILNFTRGLASSGSFSATIKENDVFYLSTNNTPYKVAMGFNISRTETNITLNENTEMLAENGYRDETITAITIPSKVKSIPVLAFLRCSKLTTINLGNIEKIRHSAFKNCSALTSLTIPNTCTFIGADAFLGTALISITIPSNVKYIESGAFDGLTTLKTAIIDSVEIYKALHYDGNCGKLIKNATTVKVLKSVVDSTYNDYLTDATRYTKTTEGDYYVFTKV